MGLSYYSVSATSDLDVDRVEGRGPFGVVNLVRRELA
jgi:hypothetical protein